MVALQIRDVPDDVRRALVDQADSRGQSLQAFLLELVRAEARRSANLTVLAAFADRTDGTQLRGPEATTALDEARSQRPQ